MGDLHDLLLVEDDAVGGLEDGFEVRVGIGDPGPSVFAVDEVVHHAGLQGTGAEQGHQGGDVVEAVRLQFFDQLLHAPGFELEDGGGFAAFEQGEGLGVVHGDGADGDGGLIGLAADCVDCLERPVDDGQGAQPQEVELDQAGLFYVVLVELGDQVFPAGFAVEGGEVGQPGGRDDHAPGVLAGVAGQALQFAGQVDDGLDFFFVPVGALEVFAFFQGLVEGHARLEGHHLGDAVHHAVGVAHDPAHVPHYGLGRQGAEGDDLGNRFAAVTLGHIVDDPIPVFHAEVHVEIRHGDALGIQEALEQQVVLDRVQVRDFEGVGNQGAGPGPAPRSHRDVIVLGPADEVGDDQEVTREAHLVDDAEFQFQALVIALAPLVEVGRSAADDAFQAPFQSLFGFHGEEFLHGHPFREREIREMALAQVQLQIAALGDLDAVFQRLRNVGEAFRHFLGGAQILLSAVETRAARVVQGAAVVDADPRLVGLEVLGIEKPHVVGRYHRRALAGGQFDAMLDVFGFVLASGADQFQVIAIAEDLEPTVEQFFRLVPATGEERAGHVAVPAAREGDQALRRLPDPSRFHLRHAQVLAFQVGAGDEPGQVQVTGPILDQHQQAVGFVGVVPVADPQVRAGDGLDAGRDGGLVEAHQAKQIALIGNRDGGHTLGRRRRHQWLDARQAVDQ